MSRINNCDDVGALVFASWGWAEALIQRGDLREAERPLGVGRSVGSRATVASVNQFVCGHGGGNSRPAGRGHFAIQ